MAKKVRVVLNRKAFGTEVLHKAVKPVMDDVQEQVDRNEDTDRTNVVATAPAAFEQAHGVLSQMLGMVVV